MLLTNHTLTGVLLGLTVDNPVLLAPTAVASHLACDALPHLGFDRPKTIQPNFRHTAFLVWGTMDFVASGVVVGAACFAWPHRAGHIVIGTLGAMLPDLTYIPIIVFGPSRIFRIPGYHAIIRFLARIQWYEKPLGFITEVVWAALMLTLLKTNLG